MEFLEQFGLRCLRQGVYILTIFFFQIKVCAPQTSGIWCVCVCVFLSNLSFLSSTQLFSIRVPKLWLGLKKMQSKYGKFLKYTALLITWSLLLDYGADNGPILGKNWELWSLSNSAPGLSKWLNLLLVWLASDDCNLHNRRTGLEMRSQQQCLSIKWNDEAQA